MNFNGLNITYIMDKDFGWVNNLTRVLNNVLFPIIIVLASVGTIYAIYLGVMMAKAENAEKREEAKKRIINAVIALVIVVVLILLLQLFLNYAPGLLGIEKSKTTTSEEDYLKWYEQAYGAGSKPW